MFVILFLSTSVFRIRVFCHSLFIYLDSIDVVRIIVHLVFVHYGRYEKTLRNQNVKQLHFIILIYLYWFYSGSLLFLHTFYPITLNHKNSLLLSTCTFFWICSQYYILHIATETLRILFLLQKCYAHFFLFHWRSVVQKYKNVFFVFFLKELRLGEPQER